MASASSITLFSAIDKLNKLTAELANHVQKNGIPEPSLASTSPTELWSAQDDYSSALKASIVDAATEVSLLSAGPGKFLRLLMCTHYDLASLHASLDWAILDKLPLEGSGISADELSKATGLSAERVYRVLVLLKTQYILEEPTPGLFTQSAITAALLKDAKLKASTEFHLDESTKAAVEMSNYFRDRPVAPKAEDSPFKYKWGLPLYEYYKKKDVVRGARFANAMQGVTSVDRSNNSLSGWFAEHPESDRKLVIDVGGGNGHVSMALAKEHPQFEFLVQDAWPGMFAETSKNQPAEIKGRVNYMQHSFFDPQPSQPKGRVKAYFIRQCLHNWSDEECCDIIRKFIPIMESDPEVRLLINESVLPKPGDIPVNVEREMRQLDIGMLVMVNSKQRDEQGWKELVHDADSRLKIVSISKDSTFGTMGVVEVVLGA